MIHFLYLRADHDRNIFFQAKQILEFPDISISSMTKGEPASYILYTILLKSITTTLQNKAPQCPADISQTFVTSRHFLEERVTLHLTSPWERHSSNGKEIMSDSIYPEATVSNPDVAPISFYRSHSALQSLHHSRSTSKMLH